jgi:hypothetical protein
MFTIIFTLGAKICSNDNRMRIIEANGQISTVAEKDDITLLSPNMQELIHFAKQVGVIVKKL